MKQKQETHIYSRMPRMHVNVCDWYEFHSKSLGRFDPKKNLWGELGVEIN